MTAATAGMTASPAAPPRINGQPIAHPGERLDDAVLRQRACSELLRQAAQQAGLLAREERAAADGVLSQAASAAIERLLERALQVPEPDAIACRRHHAAQRRAWRQGERARLRHILFAVTPGVNLAALRERAEQTLLELRCDATGELFGRRAAELSNCPSGAHGGALGWLGPGDCAAEFARAVFGRADAGVLPRLVHSRFGLHVVEVLERDPGRDLPFEAVQDAVRLALYDVRWATALRHYLHELASRATLEGVTLDGNASASASP